MGGEAILVGFDRLTRKGVEILPIIYKYLVYNNLCQLFAFLRDTVGSDPVCPGVYPEIVDLRRSLSVFMGGCEFR